MVCQYSLLRLSGLLSSAILAVVFLPCCLQAGITEEREAHVLAGHGGTSGACTAASCPLLCSTTRLALHLERHNGVCLCARMFLSYADNKRKLCRPRICVALMRCCVHREGHDLRLICVDLSHSHSIAATAGAGTSRPHAAAGGVAARSGAYCLHSSLSASCLHSMP